MATRATVQGGSLQYEQDGVSTSLPVDSPQWFTWLARAERFAVNTPAGRYTARKERAGNRRGTAYWRAYRKQGGKLRRVYLGTDTQLTLARLTAAALELSEGAASPEGGLNRQQGAQAHVRDPLPDVQDPDTASAGIVDVIASKLEAPVLGRNLVPCPGLWGRLDAGIRAKLTVVVAPAGFGKTTLLNSWLATADRNATGVARVSPAISRPRIAWITLDPHDDDPRRFLTYVVAALDAARPGAGAGTKALLRSSQPLALEALLVPLLSAFGAADAPATPLMLVLDDYHTITSPEIHAGVAFLLNHLPRDLRIVIASRVDPPVGLARLRVRGELTEIRADDLRFTRDEAAAFLTRVMALRLESRHIDALDQRTEGWIAGLQLAALALRGRLDLDAFVRGFGGSNRWVLDYLTEEVLAQQPEHMQSFLLQTSILDRLSGPLCAAVTGLTHSQSLLEELEGGNLFIVPLDDDRRWYRLHHLFREVLRDRLHHSTPDEQIAVLHRRAAHWYLRHETMSATDIDVAIHHTLAAGMIVEAARLVESAALPALMRGEMATLRRWLAALPAAMVRGRPFLSLATLGLSIGAGDTVAIEERLSDAAQALADAEARLSGGDDDGGMLSPLNLQIVRAEVAAARAFADYITGHLEQARDQFVAALALAPEMHHALRWRLTGNLGYAYILAGEMDAAERVLAVSRRAAVAAGDPLGILISTCFQGLLEVERGRLTAAEPVLHEALAEAQAYGWSSIPRLGDVYVELGIILYERNQLDEAQLGLRLGISLAEQGGQFETVVRGTLTLAHLFRVQGDNAQAEGALAQATRAVNAFPVRWLSVALEAARVRFAATRMDLEAVRYEAVSRVDDPALDYEHAPLALAMARVDLVLGNAEEARRALHAISAIAERRAWGAVLIQALVLGALAEDAAGSREAALSLVEHALERAAPQAYIRVFADEGMPMVLLLRSVAERDGPRRVNAQSMLAAFALNPSEAPQSSSMGLLSHVELLSPREQEVLALIAAGSTNAEIARLLIISLSTVKAHIHSIFAKLRVRSRTQAIAQARATGMLP